MSEKIDETLKKLAEGMQSGKSLNNRSTEPKGSHEQGYDLPGDPECPYCGGLGYLREDLPVGHPDFGKLEICSCRQSQVSQEVRERLFALSNLHQLQHLTFENFAPRGRVGLWPMEADSLELAFNQANQFARSLNGWLLLQGKYGCGKTHLAAAIANYVVNMGVPTLFITVPDLLDSLRNAYGRQDTTFEEHFDEIRNAHLLVLDDFGTQNATPWAQEKLFQIINYRYINRLPLVVTTNLFIGDIDARISSRLKDPELVTTVSIISPDYRGPIKEFGHHELSSLNLHHSQTFANFDLRTGENLAKDDLNSLKKAFQASQDYAKNPQGWLLFTGTYGSGKTYLAAAIANYRADTGYPPLFIVVPDLLDHLKATFSPTSNVSLDRRFEEVRTAPLLILDDLGTQSMTPWVKEKLYQLFNHRYSAELPTVITTHDYKDDVDPRLLSRFEDRRICKIHAITAPAYRGSTQENIKRSSRRRS